MREHRTLAAAVRLERQSDTLVKSDRHSHAHATQARRDAETALGEAHDILNDAYASWPAALNTRLDPEALQRFSVWIGVQEVRVAETAARADTARAHAEAAAERLALSRARADIVAERTKTLRRKLQRRRDERHMAELETRYAYKAVRP